MRSASVFYLGGDFCLVVGQQLYMVYCIKESPVPETPLRKARIILLQMFPSHHNPRYIVWLGFSIPG